MKQLIFRNRRGLEAEIAGLEAEDVKLRRLVGAKEGTQPRSKSLACQASIFGLLLLLHQLTCRRYGPMNLVFMLVFDSGAGQHVMPSPWSFKLQRGRTSRVL